MFMPRLVDFTVVELPTRDLSPMLNALTIADGDPDYEAPNLSREEALQLFANIAKVG